MDGLEKTFFNVRVFNSNSPTHQSLSLQSYYQRHEQEKRRKYEQRVSRIERVSFTPIVLSCTGGTSKTTSTFLKRLASLLADKKDTYQMLTRLLSYQSSSYLS